MFDEGIQYHAESNWDPEKCAECGVDTENGSYAEIVCMPKIDLRSETESMYGVKGAYRNKDYLAGGNIQVFRMIRLLLRPRPSQRNRLRLIALMSPGEGWLGFSRVGLRIIVELITQSRLRPHVLGERAPTDNERTV